MYCKSILNVSVRHASADTETLMSWAPVETFAFVLYYKQRTRENARARVAVWTRELIDAALACEGSYYLPYQAHATDDQFHRAYPRALKAFDLKATVDPTFRFRNVIWDRYYGSPDTMTKPRQISTSSEFHQVFGYTGSRDDFYRFLQVVFRLQPEDRMHQLIREACERGIHCPRIRPSILTRQSTGTCSRKWAKSAHGTVFSATHCLRWLPRKKR